MARLSRTLPQATILCAGKSKAAHVELGFCVEGMRVVRNGYDLEQFAPKSVPTDVKMNLVGDMDVPLIGMVARFDANKDHANLLEACSLLKRNGCRFRIVLIGGGMNSGNMSISAIVANSNLAEEVLLLGQRADIPEIMNAIDIHVLSSQSEAFPNVLAEAMACGTPCVTTDVGDAADIVGNTGWVVPPKDPNALASAIEVALSERKSEKWQMRCKAARKRIEENFSIARMVDGYNAVWREVLSAAARN
jgi:glycosyltransferase involved in cell wall biosynthesis